MKRFLTATAVALSASIGLAGCVILVPVPVPIPVSIPGPIHYDPPILGEPPIATEPPVATETPMASEPPIDFEEIAAQTLALATTLISMAEDAAIASITEAGFDYRVVARDGENFPVTLDYRPTRINLTINKGVVADVNVG